jgi:hypothetical protein
VANSVLCKFSKQISGQVKPTKHEEIFFTRPELKKKNKQNNDSCILTGHQSFVIVEGGTLGGATQVGSTTLITFNPLPQISGDPGADEEIRRPE